VNDVHDQPQLVETEVQTVEHVELAEHVEVVNSVE
jgi:hypothetical protein